MNLVEPVSQLKKQIEEAFNKRLIRMGLGAKEPKPRHDDDYERVMMVINALQQDTMKYPEARKKYLHEVTFTLFNRLAGLKAMEVRQLIPEILQVRAQHGERSFDHTVWLQENPSYRDETLDGLESFVKDRFKKYGEEINLYSPDYPYDLFPEAHQLKDIIRSFNESIAEEDWKKDDILGWLYEAYNKKDYQEFKESGEKIEYDKLALSSQMFTPRWVVEFLVDNSLGKYWLEINPLSKIKDHHDIANVPEVPLLDKKEITEIKLIDPACGSGNFLLYAFELFFEIYQEKGYRDAEIPALILKNNLYGIDIDERATQIAILQLFIKARMINKTAIIREFSIVSSNFHLPDFEYVLERTQEKMSRFDTDCDFMSKLWEELRQAYKYGSLIRIKDNMKEYLEGKKKGDHLGLFDSIKVEDDYYQRVIKKLKNYIETSLQNGMDTRFIKHQSVDALKFGEMMLSDFDIAVANPPYTDSANYGKELRTYVKEHYKNPVKFHQNLYSCFIKLNSDLLNDQGKLGMIHPLTFMYIKTYEGVREFILENYHVNVLVEFGIGGVFHESKINADVSGYVFEKNCMVKPINETSFFMNLQPYKNWSNKNLIFKESFSNYIGEKKDKHNYQINQTKLKIIDGYPFIYWISDSFREKFKEKPLGEVLDVKVGLQTGDNLRFLRLWWEVNESDISVDYKVDKKKWVPYQKGGPYKKWYGNNWLVVNWENDGYEIKNCFDGSGKQRSRPQNIDYYFKEGITYTDATAKESSFRYFHNNTIFGVNSNSLFKKNDIYYCLSYYLGLLNSRLINYITSSLNSTVHTLVGDMIRVPFINPGQKTENIIESLTDNNISLKKHQYSFDIIEKEYTNNPLKIPWDDASSVNDRLLSYIEFCHATDAKILLNEAFTDQLIFDVYDLTDDDREMVLSKEGLPAGMYPVFSEDRDVFIQQEEDLLSEVKDYIERIDLESRDRNNLKEQVEELYLRNHSTEQISKELKLNPISVVAIIKESTEYPKKLAYQVAHELILDLLRAILKEDEDGIAIIESYANQPSLEDRLKSKLFEQEFSSGDISKLEIFLNSDLKSYLLDKFFKDECSTLKLFRFLPATPFIWHLTSGPEHSIDVFTLIYKWNRDSVFRIKSYYLDKRRSDLTNRLSSLSEYDSADAEKKKDKVRRQLEELDTFNDKLDELLATGYDPILDDGVGKNIAPLQKIGLLSTDVLSKGQLKKFLHADW